MPVPEHIQRFAPSPTGPLHLGHAFSALTAWRAAQVARGTFLLRIEDIDQSRARPQHEQAIYDDLHWLGLRWPVPVLRQSARLPAYRAGLARLWARGLLYACTCNRRDIAAAASAPQESAPALGPDGLVYPGTCRHAAPRSGPLPGGAALRLDMRAALATLPALPGFHETGAAPDGRSGWQRTDPGWLLEQCGDVVLARREMGTSYHLAVVLDDAHQAISHVTRGQDLFEATHVHALLQALLGLPTPVYHHHRLIRDPQGRRLAKRDDARALAHFRAEGASPADLCRMIGLPA